MKTSKNSQSGRGLIICLIAMFALQAAIIAYLAYRERTKPARIAYVDTATLFIRFNEAKKVRTELEAFNKGWEAKAKALKDTMDAFMKKVGAEYNGASESAKEKMRAEMQARNQQMDALVRSNQVKALEKEKAMMDPVLKKVNVFMKEYAEGNGYDLVLGSTTQGSILAGGPKLDITEKVIEALNGRYP